MSETPFAGASSACCSAGVHPAVLATSGDPLGVSGEEQRCFRRTARCVRLCAVPRPRTRFGSVDASCLPKGGSRRVVHAIGQHAYLAIELAAARCRNVPGRARHPCARPPELLADRARPPAQQTLAGVLDWSVSGSTSSSTYLRDCRCSTAAALWSRRNESRAAATSPRLTYWRLSAHSSTLVSSPSTAPLPSIATSSLSRSASMQPGSSTPLNWRTHPVSTASPSPTCPASSATDSRAETDRGGLTQLARELANLHAGAPVGDQNAAGRGRRRHCRRPTRVLERAGHDRDLRLERRAPSPWHKGGVIDSKPSPWRRQQSAGFTRLDRETRSPPSNQSGTVHTDADLVAQAAWGGRLVPHQFPQPKHSRDDLARRARCEAICVARGLPERASLTVVSAHDRATAAELVEHVGEATLSAWYRIWTAQVVGSPDRLAASEVSLADVVDQTEHVGAAHPLGVAARTASPSSRRSCRNGRRPTFSGCSTTPSRAVVSPTHPLQLFTDPGNRRLRTRPPRCAQRGAHSLRRRRCKGWSDVATIPASRRRRSRRGSSRGGGRLPRTALPASPPR